MSLQELQERMGAAVMRPLTASYDTRNRAKDADFVKPNDRLTGLERLEIYNRQYWYRVLDSFAEDFPGLAAVVGRRAFDRISRAYIDACPSRSFTLRNLGSRLEQWLRDHPGYAGRAPALAIDMVRLEWAHIEAFDNAAAPVLGPEDLLELGPDFRAGLQPCVRLLRLSYPVDNLRIRVNSDLDEHAAASNAVGMNRERRTRRYAVKLQPEEVHLAVHRVDFTVYYRRLDAGEFLMLQAIEQGHNIGDAVEAAGSVVPKDVERWFAAWAALGWLCRP